MSDRRNVPSRSPAAGDEQAHERKRQADDEKKRDEKDETHKRHSLHVTHLAGMFSRVTTSVVNDSRGCDGGPETRDRERQEDTRPRRPPAPSRPESGEVAEAGATRDQDDDRRRQGNPAHNLYSLHSASVNNDCRLAISDDTTPDDFVLAATDEREGFRVSLVLFEEDARGEGLFGVGVEDGDDALRDDGAAVERLVNEVDGAA